MYEKKKISVVVPIYNVEKYLPECIESVQNQSYMNLEIILVDDGSPDNSGKIADEYAKKFDEEIGLYGFQDMVEKVPSTKIRPLR